MNLIMNLIMVYNIGYMNVIDTVHMSVSLDQILKFENPYVNKKSVEPISFAWDRNIFTVIVSLI